MNKNVICFLIYNAYQKLGALKLMAFKSRESIKYVILCIKTHYPAHVLATGKRASTWMRRTGAGRRTGKRKTTGRRTGARRRQGQEGDREDNEYRDGEEGKYREE